MNKNNELENYKIYNACLNTFVIGEYKEGLNLEEVAIKYSSKENVDGLILLDKYNKKEGCIFKMIFYNRDGSNGYMCGNGIRCLMRFAYEEGMLNINERYLVDTFTGIRECIVLSEKPFTVNVNLGRAYYDSMHTEIEEAGEFFNKDFFIDGKKINLSCIFLATHHCVSLVKDKKEIEKIIESGLGEKLKGDPFFKKGVNANFVYVIDRKNIFVRTCERGVGWTLACGTGASSSFAVLNRMGKVDDKVTVHFEKGRVEASKNEKGEIILEGIASIGIK